MGKKERKGELMDFKELPGNLPNTIRPGMIKVSEITLESTATTAEDYLFLTVAVKVYSVLHPTVKINFKYKGILKYALNGMITDDLWESECEVIKQDLERMG